ncbi:glycoside hydrolase family 16 protein [Hydnomerulius pinastri MD-312]|nr:glycoside hydrolase family 16 protein [Hydnomerulius pinastri MD-312]
MQPFTLLTLALSSTLALSPSPVSARNSFLSHAHKVAIKHSSSLARDLRVAFGSVRVAQPGSVPSQQVYCVSSGGGGVTVPSNGNSGNSSSSGTSTASGAQPSGTASVPPSSWKPISTYSGSSFFNGWSFFTNADPTDGNVQYVDQSTAQGAGLIEINQAGNAVMRVETTPTVQSNRMSVRVTTEQTFTEGLVIMDAVHMPTGCGTWPAFWTNGPNWPNGGEIDIVEGVNNYTNNQATIHTQIGCNLTSSSQSVLNITGSIVGGTDCAAAQSNNEGCGVRSPSDTSFGSGFNSVGGGVYAMYWENAVGIKVWYFQRGSIPADITGGAPQPQNWPTPLAFWPNSNVCNTGAMFSDHSAIFDTTLCGDWAEGVWGSTGVPGQDVSCQQQTGFATCAEFVQASGASFNEAYMITNYTPIFGLRYLIDAWTVHPRIRYLAAIAQAEADYARAQAVEEQQRAEAYARRQHQENMRHQLILDAIRARGERQYARDYSDFEYAPVYGHPANLKRPYGYSEHAQKLAERRARERQAALEHVAREREARMNEWKRLVAHRQQEEARRAQEEAQKFANMFTRPRAVEPKQQPKRETVQRREDAEGTPLKNRLESRLMNEYEFDIRDTLKSLLDSLAPSQSAPAAPAPATESTETVAPVTVPVSKDTKGKSKQVSFSLPSDSTTAAAAAASDSETDSEVEATTDPAFIQSSLSAIDEIGASFRALESEFEFPEELDFDRSADGSELKLAYSSRNAPLRFYDNALSQLLSRLDAIPSHGSRNPIATEIEPRSPSTESSLSLSQDEPEQEAAAEAVREDDVVEVDTYLLAPSSPSSSPAPSPAPSSEGDDSDIDAVLIDPEHEDDAWSEVSS